MSDSFESMLRANLDFYMDDIFTGLPAQVVGVQKLQDGLIDVQPVINKIFSDGSRVEFPIIYSVPVIMPTTLTSAVTMPLVQGDSVWLMFSQRDLDTFKNGSDIPHDPSSFRTFNLNDAIAIIGLSTVDKTRLNSENHSKPVDLTSLCITHNIGTDREVMIKLTNDGSVIIDCAKDFTLLAKSASVKCDSIDIQTTDFNIQSNSFEINSSTLDIKATVTIDGMNLNNFMKSHTHPYTDDGRSMVTGSPQGF